jgi:MFS family permease
MSSVQAITAVTVSSAVVLGMVLALLGSIKLALAKRLNIGEGRIGGLLFAFNLALIPMMLICGLLIDLIGVRAMLIAGSVLTSIALFTVSLSPTYNRAFFAVFLAGLGGAAMYTATMVLMPVSFWEGKDQMTRAINLGHVFIAIGAFLTPALVDILLRTLEFRKTVSFLAMLPLVPAVLCALPPFGDPVSIFDPKTGHRPVDVFTHANFAYLMLAGVVFFFYAPLEGAIGIWTTTYLTDVGHGERGAAWILSGFWFAFMGARLLVAVLPLTKSWDPWLLVLPALFGATLLGNLSGTASNRAGTWGILLLGFLLGPLFPTLVGMVFRAFDHERGTAFGLVFSIGSLGGLFLGPWLGVRASIRHSSVASAFRVPMFLALLLLAATMVFVLANTSK